MDLNVWIEFDEPILWEGHFSEWAMDSLKNPSIPVHRSPNFPCGHDAFGVVTGLINAGKYKNGIRDSLTKYVIVPKFEIVTMVKKLYEENHIDHLKIRLNELLSFIEALPDNKKYTLVQDEF